MSAEWTSSSWTSSWEKGWTGSQAARRILSDHDVPVLFLSSHTGEEIVERMEQVTSYGYVVKHSGPAVFLASVKMALKLHAAHRELKEQEKTLRVAEEKFRTVADFTYDWESWVGPDDPYIYVSPSCERITGRNPSECMADADLMTKIIHPDDLRAFGEHQASAKSGAGPMSIDFRIATGKGEVRWIAHACQPVYGADGKYLGRRVSNRDVTERVRGEDVRARLLSILEETSDLVATCTPGGTVNYINKAGRKMLGIDAGAEFCGTHFLDVHPEWARRLIVEEGFPSAARDGMWTGETAFLHAGGWEIPTSQLIVAHKSASGEIEFMSTIARDLSEAKILQQELIHNEKMVSLGMLVSGIAHEINNPNSFITFNMPILRDYMGVFVPVVDDYARNHPEFAPFGMTYPEFREDLSRLLVNLEHGAERIDKTVKELGNFSRRGGPQEFRSVGAAVVIERALSLCRKAVAERARLFQVDIPSRLPVLETAPEALEQTLVNLLINASQAVAGADSWVRLRAYQQAEAENGDLVIEVSDNGHGMDEQTAKHAFDPFFSTKPRGTGIGLGLYVSRMLIGSIGGRITMESAPGRGSTFRIILPVAWKRREEP